MLVDDDRIVEMYEIHMQTLKRSPTTITDRIRELHRLRDFLDGTPLLSATHVDLVSWQQSIRLLTANTVRVYTTHLQQFYKWALDLELIDADPSRRLSRPRVGRGIPHPIGDQDLHNLFTICTGDVRARFALAAFAGYRAGELARATQADIGRDEASPSLLIHGKGGKQRRVPLIPILVEELDYAGVGRRPGPLFRTSRGRPFTPNFMSKDCNRWLHDILGTPSTIHSLRHWYLSNVYRITKDPVFVRDLAGHADLSTTQVYIQSDVSDGINRLAGFSSYAEQITSRRHLRAVK